MRVWVTQSEGASMNDKSTDYISYLLRAWRSNGEGGSAWRASLEDPHTGERMGFACLEDLFNFLRQETSRTDGPELDEKDRGRGHDEPI
jgi:hypothetical protein